MIKDELNNYLKTLPAKDRNINKIIMYLAKRSKETIADFQNLLNTFESIEKDTTMNKGEKLEAYKICVEQFRKVSLRSVDINYALNTINKSIIVGAEDIFQTMINNLDKLKEKLNGENPCLGSALLFLPVKLQDDLSVEYGNDD